MLAGSATDLRYAWRSLRREPTFTAAAVLTLGLGIAASVVILALVHAARIQPVARFSAPERIVDILPFHRERPQARLSFRPADFVAYREAATSFSHFAAYDPLGSFNLTGTGPPQRLKAHAVSADFFTTLGVQARLGRTFTTDETQPGADRVVLLSEHLWQRLGADASLLGRPLLLDGTPYTAVGVMPGGFGVSGGFPDIWVPLAFGPERPIDRQSGTLGGIARLRPGTSLEEARHEATVIAQRLEASFPATNEDLRFSLEPRVALMKASSDNLLMLLGAVVLVLLIAAVNVANLQLARVVAREDEMATRFSLGACRWRLARQVWLESTLLALFGAGLGLLLAAWALRALPDLHGTYLYRSVNLRINLWVVALGIGFALAAGFLAGLLPALRVLGRTAAPLTVSPGLTAGPRARRLNHALLIGQVVATFVLLAGAGLLVRSLDALVRADLGFDTAGVLSFEVAPSRTDYADGPALTAFYDALLPRLAALPGVRAAALTDGAPGGGWDVRVRAAGGPVDDEPTLRFASRLISPGFLAATGIELLRGRDLSAADRADSPPVIILSQLAAQRLFPDRDPLGQQVAWEEKDDWHTVVGIVADVRRDPLRQAAPAAYVAHAQHPTLLDTVGVRAMTLLVASDQPLSALAQPLREAVWAVDTKMPLFGLETLNERVMRYAFKPKLYTLLLGGFAFLGLVLVAVGLYGVISYGVRRRRREMALRMALGARQQDILGMVLGQGLILVGIGLALGFIAAHGLRPAIAGLLYDVAPSDPLTLLAVAGLLLAVAAVAAFLPAHHAAQADPQGMLRAE